MFFCVFICLSTCCITKISLRSINGSWLKNIFTIIFGLIKFCLWDFIYFQWFTFIIMFLVCQFNLNNQNDCNKLNSFFNSWCWKYSKKIAIWNVCKKTKLFSVVRSPHVNKTSQQQLKLDLFTFKVAVEIANKKEFFYLVEYLYNMLHILQFRVTFYKM